MNSGILPVACFVCRSKLVLDVRIYMQQTTSSDDIFRCIFAGASMVNALTCLRQIWLTEYCSFNHAEKIHECISRITSAPSNSCTLLWTLCLLMSSADNLCKQFGPRPGLTKCQAWPGSKLFDTLMVFMKEFFEKVEFGKISRRQKKHAVYFACFCCHLLTFFKINLLKNSFRKTFRESNLGSRSVFCSPELMCSMQAIVIRCGWLSPISICFKRQLLLPLGDF